MELRGSTDRNDESGEMCAVRGRVAAVPRLRCEHGAPQRLVPGVRRRRCRAFYTRDGKVQGQPRFRKAGVILK